MKILAISDIHQMISKWEKLVEVCKKRKPDIVAIAGDLLPKEEGIRKQLPFIDSLKEYAKKINGVGSKIILVLGNDDNQLAIPEMERAHKENLWYYIPENTVEIDGYEFAAMPYVPDYSFGYKFWCRGEYKENIRIDPVQYCKPLLIDENNKFETIRDYSEYLKNKKTIWDSLIDTAAKLKNINKSIWLIHTPPSNLFLDVCSDGRTVGSHAVYEFIIKYQPLLTIHGHIHESPEYNGHKWNQKEGNTLCIQGGQIDFSLHYSLIDIQNGKIIKMEHSIYDS